MKIGKRILVIAVVVAACGLLAVGCESDEGTTTTAATDAASGAASKAITVDMSEYAYDPVDAIAKAGAVTITTKNVGQLPHELVLAHTDLAPDALPTLPDGSVDEAKIEKAGDAPGEVPESAAGASKTGIIDLPAGRYVMYCNIPGHYAAGMYGTLTVVDSGSGTSAPADTTAPTDTTAPADTTSAAPPAASKPKKISIDMGEFYYRPKNAAAKAGSVTITTKNVGQAPHELVLAHTDLPPGKLPTLPDGSVDEAKIEKQGDAPGEIPETAAGASKTGTIDLPAGRYVMYCNIPGHYAAGMYGVLKTE